MRQSVVAGVILILIGTALLTFQGFTYTTEEKVLDIGPIKATAEKEKTIPFSPILGAVALASGVAMVILSSKKG
jgi:hypothetical protein